MLVSDVFIWLDYVERSEDWFWDIANRFETHGVWKREDKIGLRITFGMKFRLKNTKFVFIDAEFTGEHQFTTLVSIALCW